MLSIIAFFSFTNVFSNIISLYLILKYDVKTKFKDYPRLIKLIKYYEGSSLFCILIEVLFCLICLLLIIFSSASILGIIIYFN